ncbi:hypothetical protein Vretimale_17662, partial [Volvox reticuliferus]
GVVGLCVCVCVCVRVFVSVRGGRGGSTRTLANGGGLATPKCSAPEPSSYLPSLVGLSREYGTVDPSSCSGVVEILPSLLAFSPAAYGLPPFRDLPPSAAIDDSDQCQGGQEGQGGGHGGGVIPMDRVLRIGGKVVKGFGRGSKAWQAYAEGTPRAMATLPDGRKSCKRAA